MEPVLLVRKSLASQYELRHAQQYFRIEESRMNCGGALVIGRYSVLPFYDELERDLALVDARLVNTYQQHRWITSFAYYHELRDVTPETWDDDNIHLSAHDGAYVVKGKMSSRKHQWRTHMLADNKRKALALAKKLKDDPEIKEQGVVYRRYVPLKTYEVGHNGLPYTNEWRCYYLGQTRLSCGYYWSMADCASQAELKPAALTLADKVAAVAARFANFFALDVAETADGDWILIEINDGQMAVPGETDLDELYGNLKQAIIPATAR